MSVLRHRQVPAQARVYVRRRVLVTIEGALHVSSCRKLQQQLHRPIILFGTNLFQAVCTARRKLSHWTEHKPRACVRALSQGFRRAGVGGGGMHWILDLHHFERSCEMGISSGAKVSHTSQFRPFTAGTSTFQWMSPTATCIPSRRTRYRLEPSGTPRTQSNTTIP